jgi:hypothetical protein
MRTILIAAIVTILFIQGYAFIQLGSGEYASGFGLYHSVGGFVCFIVGLVLYLYHGTRKMGLGILAGSGLAIIAGLTGCIVYPDRGPSFLF